MKIRTTLFALAAGGAAAAIIAAAGPASAATTFTVKAGSAATGTTVSITGTTQGTSPQINLLDKTTNQKLTCTSGTASGNTKTGSGKSGTALGSITASTWTGCSGPLNLKFTVTQSGTWSINGASYASGVTTGSITGISAKVSSGTSCTFTVTGSVPVTYTNSTQILAVSNSAANLKISGVTGCFNVVKNNDVATFAANYKLVAGTSAYNPVSITSP